MYRTRTAAIALTVPLALAATAGTAAATSSTDEEATVSVLHGVPGLTVDVYANGEELIPDFEPGTLTDPLTVPAGTYDIEVFPDGEGPDGDPAIEASGVEVPEGVNATIVAHLTENGEPTASVFVNDMAELAAGDARVTARHTAAAPAVDVRVDGTPTFEGLSNADEASADVPAGTIEADVVLAGSDDTVLGPTELELAEGTNTIVYAWGSAEEENLELAVQTIDGLHGAPSGVPGGEAGLAADESSMTPWLLSLGVAALVATGLILGRRFTARQEG